MATDYILFIHGVNVRTKNYADRLFGLIQDAVKGPTVGESSRDLKEVALFWGDLTEKLEEKLRTAYQQSPYWDTFWFRNMREKLFLQFAGDTALYISRSIGAQVVNTLSEQAVAGLQSHQSEDRLHLVTHSLGTVILFDILFSSRWNQVDVPGHKSVMAIREVVYGVEPNPMNGIRLGSIHTMGSPISLFSLMDVNQSNKAVKNANGNASSHDISPGMKKLLASLHNQLGTKLPWRNFAHPGDPIASPLATLLPGLVDGEEEYLDIQDVIGNTPFLMHLFCQQPIALLLGSGAHTSYWGNKKVAEAIAGIIDQATQEKEPLPNIA